MPTQNDDKKLTDEQFAAAVDAWVASKNPEADKKTNKTGEQQSDLSEADIDNWIKSKK